MYLFDSYSDPSQQVTLGNKTLHYVLQNIKTIKTI